MNRLSSFVRSALERVTALLLLLAWAPHLFFIAMFIQTLTTEAVLVRDVFVTADGSTVRYYRFRTRSPNIVSWGTRWLRRYRLDEYLLLWSVVRGDVGLKEVMRHLKGVGNEIGA